MGSLYAVGGRGSQGPHLSLHSHLGHLWAAGVDTLDLALAVPMALTEALTGTEG